MNLKTEYTNPGAPPVTAERPATPCTISILPRRQMLQKVGLSNSTVHELRRQNQFPAPVQLTARRVGWLESEIESWLAARVAASRSIKE